MKAFFVKLLGFIKGFLPTGLLGRLWANRHPICIGITCVIAAFWIVCGLLFDEPPAVMTGWLLVFPVGMWGGYRAGKWFQDRRAARAAAAAPPAEETPAKA